MLDEVRGRTIPMNDKGKGLAFMANLPKDPIKKIQALCKKHKWQPEMDGTLNWDDFFMMRAILLRVTFEIYLPNHIEFRTVRQKHLESNNMQAWTTVYN